MGHLLNEMSVNVINWEMLSRVITVEAHTTIDAHFRYCAYY